MLCFPHPQAARKSIQRQDPTKATRVWLLLSGLMLTLAGCSDPISIDDAASAWATQNHASAAPAQIFFPQLTPAKSLRAFPAALLVGTLVEDQGCLRVIASDSNTSYLIIWPPEVSLSAVGQSVRVVAVGGTAAQVGEQIQVGGGEVAPVGAPIMQELHEPIPPACTGPYWLASGLVWPVP